ncbi:MAG TPA: IS21 family transposase [Candidatus Limnocylindrales bacterium]|nr:IS21 family transposase [Candidatus Limnocylindrales bacterium]
MRRTREILRLRLGLGQSVRTAARSCDVSVSTVVDIEARARAAGIDWAAAAAMDEAELEARLYVRGPRPAEHDLPDFAHVHREMKRRGVTLELLWLEYKAERGERAYSYSRYCELYSQWRGTLDVVMRQSHRAGEKLFVDWAGMTVPITNPSTGEVADASVFVAALGASSFTYAEVFPDQTSRSWILAHIRTFEFLGGTAEVLVPDNLKTGVVKADFFEPSLHQAYLELANYYGTTILPARVAKPRDKSKVENAVQQVERWVLAPLRNQTFFSVAEANAAVAERLAWLNDRPLSRMDGTRRSLFLELDRPALRPLPAKRMEACEWKVNAGVGIDYHVEFDRHFYSVPYQLVQKRVDVRATLMTVEVFHKSVRVASHLRSTVARHAILALRRQPVSRTL